MEDKVKSYIEHEYKIVERLIDGKTPLAKRYGKETVRLSKTRCYGVIMFTIDNLFENYNEELGKWWDNEMLPKFIELERRSDHVGR